MTRDLYWERTDYESREALAIEEWRRLTTPEDDDGDQPDPQDEDTDEEDDSPEPWDCHNDRGPDPSDDPR